MPKKLSPNSKITVSLDCDANRETEQLFIFNCLDVDQEIALTEVMDMKGDTAEELKKDLFGAIQEHLIDWQLTDGSKDPEEPVPFEPERLPKILRMVEAAEIGAKLLAKNRLSHEEKKSAESQQSSKAVCSASTAQSGSAASSSTESKSSVPDVTIVDASNAEEAESSS